MRYSVRLSSDYIFSRGKTQGKVIDNLSKSFPSPSSCMWRRQESWYLVPFNIYRVYRWSDQLSKYCQRHHQNWQTEYKNIFLQILLILCVINYSRHCCCQSVAVVSVVVACYLWLTLSRTKIASRIFHISYTMMQWKLRYINSSSL